MWSQLRIDLNLKLIEGAILWPARVGNVTQKLAVLSCWWLQQASDEESEPCSAISLSKI